MEWLKELLKTAGVEESKIDGIITNFNKEVPKHLIPKDKFNDLTNTKNQLEKDLQARDKQLEDLKKTAGATDDLKNQIQKLQDDNKAATDKYEADLKELRMTNAIKLALTGKVHDEDLVSGLIDKEKLVVGDDGKIVGLDEQVKTLKEAKAFLFVPEGDPGAAPAIKGAKPAEGDPGGKPPASMGANFAKSLNEKSKPAEKTIWD